MAPKRSASKIDRKAIRKEVKRVQLATSELHRKSWGVTSYTIVENPAGGGVLALPGFGGGYMLNNSEQGVNAEQRVGNQVKETGLRIKGMIMQASSALADVCSCVRVIVIRDHDNKGVVPTMSEILYNTSEGPSIGSLVLWSNRKRFTFLFDQTFPLQAQASGASTANACCPVDIDLRADQGLSNTLTYDSTSASSVTLQNGGIFCYMWFCNMSANPAAGSSPIFTGTGNFFFHDI